MKEPEFDKLITEAHERRHLIMFSKGKDYDQEADRLSSFKKVAIILGTLEVKSNTPSGVAMTLLVLKLVRDANLRNKPPENEGRQDTLDDAANYLDLYLALETERMKADGRSTSN